MKKLIFTHISSTLGIALVVLISAILGGIFLQEARSFMDPGSGPGASGTLAVNGGVMETPAKASPARLRSFKDRRRLRMRLGQEVLVHGHALLGKLQGMLLPVPVVVILLLIFRVSIMKNLLLEDV